MHCKRLPTISVQGQGFKCQSCVHTPSSTLCLTGTVLCRVFHIKSTSCVICPPSAALESTSEPPTVMPSENSEDSLQCKSMFLLAERTCSLPYQIPRDLLHSIMARDSHYSASRDHGQVCLSPQRTSAGFKVHRWELRPIIPVKKVRVHIC